MKRNWSLIFLCSMFMMTGGEVDWVFWLNRIPHPLKQAASSAVLTGDKLLHHAILPAQPIIDAAQKNDNPLLALFQNEIEKSLPELHNLFCYRYKSNLTTFMHYSPHHPHDAHTLVSDDVDSLEKSKYDPNLPTKFIIHGFMDWLVTTDYWMIEMKNALLGVNDFNVIIVDWSCGNFFPYYRSIENTKEVADEIANLLTFLKDSIGLRMEDVHLIGHSLGAQITGFLGKKIRGLGRISALDPAGAHFYGKLIKYRLSPSDAQFVDVLHTNGALNAIEGIGYPSATGHVDFYPDGGRHQKSCHNRKLTDFEDFGIHKALVYEFVCDHARALDYYIESINQAANPNGCQFVAVKCKDWATYRAGGCGGCEVPGKCAYMGYNAYKYDMDGKNSQPNEFYLSVNREKPFCISNYKSVFEKSNSDDDLPFARNMQNDTWSGSETKTKQHPNVDSDRSAAQERYV